MGRSGLGLMASSPPRPVHDEPGAGRQPEDKASEKIADFRQTGQQGDEAYEALI